MELELSIIIPVLNEEKRINSCINSLLLQTYDLNKSEVIFVDGNSTDHTLSILKDFQSKYQFIKILNNPDKITPKSMNIGIRESKGRFIIRLDAHSFYHEDYIEKCVSFLKSHPDIDNVGGVAETQSYGYIGNSIAKVLSSRFGVGNSSFRVGGKGGKVDTVPFGCFRRTIFDKIGYFDERLLRSEDNEFNSRIIKNGGTVWLNPEIKFVYYGRDTISGLLSMALKNGNSLFWTMRIDKKSMKIRHFVPFLFLLSLCVLCSLCWIRVALDLLILEMSLYSLLNLFFSFILRKRRYGFLTFFLFPLFHLCYGVGSLLSLFFVKLY